MSTETEFIKTISEGYTFSSECYQLGCGVFDGKVIAGTKINIPYRMLNRHGLIAGATGTGKTKTLQVLTEGLSDAGIPVLVLDIKGDLSGLAAPGTANARITDRYKLLNLDYKPAAYPVELLTLSNEPGVRLRATVSEFGPVLLSKILELNDTQSGFVAIIFKYCDDTKMPLLDLKDFIRVLQYIGDEGKKELEKTYGKISTSSTGTILRKAIELQQQGADGFFGEKSFEVDDLMRTAEDGRGIVSILRVPDLQDRPRLFSTFMLQMLAELYAVNPEEGDLDKPKLVMFIDEAHLVFRDANKALLGQVETIVRLIRSKGIGIFFCTQNPMDIPAPILAQLGLKVQHSLRAFTAADRKTIRQTAENYPETTFYKTEDLLTGLGIGEALVTALNEKGAPTPLVHCMIASPKSRMDILTPGEISQLVAGSKIISKYNQQVDSQSAYEMLNAKLEDAAQAAAEKETPVKKTKEARKEDKSIFDDPLVKSMTRTAGNTIVRSLLGALGLGGRRRKSLF